MGWWDCGIMGGDTPEDIWFELKDAAKTPLEPETGGHEPWFRADGLLSRVVLQAGTPVMVEHIKRKYPWNGEFGVEWACIAWEVLGFKLIKYGAPIDAELKDDILIAIERDMAEKFWAAYGTQDNRDAELRNLRDALRRYDGTPLQMNEAGVFEKIGAILGGM